MNARVPSQRLPIKYLFVYSLLLFIFFNVSPDLNGHRVCAAEKALQVAHSTFEMEEGEEEGAHGDYLVELIIEVDPGADIFIDGRFVGNGDSVSLLIMNGEHIIRLINDDLGIDYLVRKSIEASKRGGQVVLRYSLS